MHATLYSRGHLLIGPSKFRFVPTGQSLETAMQALLDEENTNRIGAEVEAIDVQTREMFDKQWCGPIDLSSEGVAALEDWDTAYAKQQAKKIAAAEQCQRSGL